MGVGSFYMDAGMLDISVQNAWSLHQINHAKEDPSYFLFSFRREILNTMFLKYSHDGVNKR